MCYSKEILSYNDTKLYKELYIFIVFIFCLVSINYTTCKLLNIIFNIQQKSLIRF